MRIPDTFFYFLFKTVFCLSTLTKLSLIFVSVTALAGCNREVPTKYTWDTPWTVEVVNRDLKVVLEAPFGAFRIQRASDIDYANLRVEGLSSITMQYHVESRLPYDVWKNMPNRTGDDIYTRADIITTDKGNNFGVIKKDVYFGEWRNTNKRPPDLIAKEVGSVWNNTAFKYENFDTTWYVIEERSELDGTVIDCRNSAVYCSLHGARATKTVGLTSLFVPISDVENWRDYQELLQEKVRSAILSVESIASDRAR